MSNYSSPIISVRAQLSNLMISVYDFTYYNIFPNTPFYAKQSQFQVGQNKRKHSHNKHLGLIGHLVIQKKQSQFKPNKAKNKPNTNPIKANSNPNKPNFLVKVLYDND